MDDATHTLSTHAKGEGRLTALHVERRHRRANRRTTSFSYAPRNSTNRNRSLSSMAMQSRWVEAIPPDKGRAQSTIGHSNRRRKDGPPHLHSPAGKQTHLLRSRRIGKLNQRQARGSSTISSRVVHLAFRFTTTSQPMIATFVGKPFRNIPKFHRPTDVISRRWCDKSDSRGSHVRHVQAWEARLASTAEVEREARGRHLARERMERNRSRMARIGFPAKHGRRSAEDEGACSLNVQTVTKRER